MDRLDSQILRDLPAPAQIHREMGQLLRQVSLLRRLLTLARAAREEQKTTAHARESEAIDAR